MKMLISVSLAIVPLVGCSAPKEPEQHVAETAVLGQTPADLLYGLV